MTESATQAIELIRRIIADDTADLRERVQHLESKAAMFGPIASEEPRYHEDSDPPGYRARAPREDGGDPPPQAEQLRELLHVKEDLDKRLEMIKELHKLDATPVQWTRGDQGKMVEAPPGLWEIACVACNHKTVWREGDKKPPQCKTWRIANGESV